MGREVKRVAMDFDWSLRQTWVGYLNPHYQHRPKCADCNGSGLNPATRQLDEDWYDLNGIGIRWGYTRDAQGRAIDTVGTTRRWCDKLTQDEVDALVEAGRLREWRGRDDGGWVTAPRTAEEVNAANGPGGHAFHDLYHDAINQWIAVKARAMRLGVYGQCETCRGKGAVWESRAWRHLAKKWRRTEPPKGEGWQMWETTSEGSPISPVCESPEALARWLVDNNGSAFGSQGASYEEWLAMIQGTGWAPSAVAMDGELLSGVAAVGKVDSPDRRQ